MRKFFLAAALILGAILPAAAQNNARPIFDNSLNGGSKTQDVTPAFPLPTSLGSGSKAVGTTTWTKTTVTLTGASQTLLAASTTRTGFIVYNSSANATAFVDISGGTAVSEAGLPATAGTFLGLTGLVAPKTLITVIGTLNQTLTVWEGN